MSETATTQSPTGPSHEVDPWRFTGKFLRGILEGQIPNKPTHGPIPWAPVAKSLSECNVALLTSAGLSMKGDEPFDMEGERKRPSWGDPSWRKLSADATADSIEANHLHIDTGYLKQDLNVALPLEHLRALAADGRIGSVAGTHYSTMGFQGASSKVLEDESAPAIAQAMIQDHVDLVILAPV